MRHLIIYHKEDNDGVFSCAIAKYYLMKILHLDEYSIDCAGHTYKTLNDLYKQDKEFSRIAEVYQSIIMVDISFNDRNAMITLKNKYAGRFMWIDHHTAVIKDSNDNGYSDISGLRDIMHSALLNTWRFFFDKDDAYFSKGICPLLFKYLSGWDSWSYDTWGFSLDEVRYVNVGINEQYEIDINLVYPLVESMLDNMITDLSKPYEKLISSTLEIVETACNIGRNICKHEDKENYKLIQEFAEQDWMLENGRKACAIFVQQQTSSLMFSSLRNTDIKAGIAFKRQKTGCWCVSLYNINADDTFNCGQYLKEHFNGGGHIGAAGCIIDNETFCKLLKRKELI